MPEGVDRDGSSPGDALFRPGRGDPQSRYPLSPLQPDRGVRWFHRAADGGEQFLADGGLAGATDASAALSYPAVSGSGSP
jgi:hypothetical protein